LREFGAPVAGAFGPGASRERVRRVLRDEGLSPHDDLVTWWGWHDGAETDAPVVESGPGLYHSAENTLLGPWHILTLGEALRTRRWQLETHRAAGLEEAFPESWLPLLTTDGAGDLCADTARSGSPTLQIRDVSYTRDSPPQFDSLSQFVACILDVFAAGLVVPAAWDARVPSVELASLAANQRRLVIW
jgi:hypothetical protein